LKSATMSRSAVESEFSFQPDDQPEMPSATVYFQVLGSPQQPCKLLRVLDVPTLSRQRPRVRVPSSPPFSTEKYDGLVFGLAQACDQRAGPISFYGRAIRRYNHHNWSKFVYEGAMSSSFHELRSGQSDSYAKAGGNAMRHRTMLGCDGPAPDGNRGSSRTRCIYRCDDSSRPYVTQLTGPMSHLLFFDSTK
jgi:hypothetical protein